MAELFAGAEDDECLCIVETAPAADPFDFTTVVSAEITVKNPKGVELSWTWAIGAKTVDYIRLYHYFAADGSDIPTAGTYRITGRLVTASAKRRLTPINIVVKAY